MGSLHDSLVRAPGSSRHSQEQAKEEEASLCHSSSWPGDGQTAFPWWSPCQSYTPLRLFLGIRSFDAVLVWYIPLFDYSRSLDHQAEPLPLKIAKKYNKKGKGNQGFCGKEINILLTNATHHCTSNCATITMRL